MKQIQFKFFFSKGESFSKGKSLYKQKYDGKQLKPKDRILQCIRLTGNGQRRNHCYLQVVFKIFEHFFLKIL